MKQTRAMQGGYPLSGLIRCATCGMPYLGGGGPINPPWPCPGRTGTLARRIVEPLVVAEGVRVVSDPHVRELIGEEIDQQIAVLIGDPAPRREALPEERKKLEDRRENLVLAI